MAIRLERTRVFLVVSAAAMTFAISGCCGGGPSNTCTAAMEYAGGKYSSKGVGNSKAVAQKEAELGVCLAYCQEDDPLVDDAWKKWKTTPDGKRAKTEKSFDINIQPPLKTFYDKCKARCGADVAAKKATVTTTCST